MQFAEAHLRLAPRSNANGTQLRDARAICQWNEYRAKESMQQTQKEHRRWHQYHVLLGVRKLKATPPRDPLASLLASTSISAWYTPLRPRTIEPNPPSGFVLAGALCLAHQTTYERRHSILKDRCVGPSTAISGTLVSVAPVPFGAV